MKDKFLALINLGRMNAAKILTISILLVAIIEGAYTFGERRVTSNVKAQMVTICKDGANRVQQDANNYLEGVEAGRVQAQADVWMNFCSKTLPERVAGVTAAKAKIRN